MLRNSLNQALAFVNVEQLNLINPSPLIEPRAITAPSETEGGNGPRRLHCPVRAFFNRVPWQKPVDASSGNRVEEGKHV